MNILLEEGQYLNVTFREKQGEVEIKWQNDMPILTVFLVDDGTKPSKKFEFLNGYSAESQASLAEY